MAEFAIEGGKKLEGEIQISGSKNAVLPCIAAALLTKEEILLENVPAIDDVEKMLEAARFLGAKAAHDKNKKTLSISAKNLTSHTLPENIVKKLRASILFSGTLIGRMRQAILPYPGGDNIGSRPVLTHLNALKKLGVLIHEDGLINFNAPKLKGADIILEEPSVTATENLILAAALAEGKTRIHIAASEPHVQELMTLLKKMGAKIKWADIGVIEIEGVKSLKGATFRINPDELEISGFAALAAATRSQLLLRDVDFKYLDAVILQLDKMGVEYDKEKSALRIKKSQKEYQSFRIQAGLYPKLVSDHLPPFSVLATQAKGDSLIHEWMYEGRLKYITELAKMGAKARILDPHRAIISGPTKLKGAEIESYDIRAGLTVIIAALVAEGKTVISGIENVDRGYESLEMRLGKIGASIKRN